MHFWRNEASILGSILVVISQIIYAYKLWPSNFIPVSASLRNYYKNLYGDEYEDAAGSPRGVQHGANG